MIVVRHHHIKTQCSAHVWFGGGRRVLCAYVVSGLQLSGMLAALVVCPSPASMPYLQQTTTAPVFHGASATGFGWVFFVRACLCVCMTGR